MNHHSKERKPFTGWYRLRFETLRRDNFICRYCGQAAPNVRLEVDHVISVVEGGENVLSNLVTSCYACNRGKNSLWLAENRQAQPRERPPVRTNAVANYIEEHGPSTGSEIAAALGKEKANIFRELRHGLQAGRFTKLPRQGHRQPYAAIERAAS